MLHGRAQRSAAQHSTAQHSTAQHSTAQHSTAHSTAQHSLAQYTAQHDKARHSKHNRAQQAQRSAAQHSTAQHSTAQHSTAQHSMAMAQNGNGTTRQRHGPHWPNVKDLKLSSLACFDTARDSQNCQYSCSITCMNTFLVLQLEGPRWTCRTATLCTHTLWATFMTTCQVSSMESGFKTSVLVC